MAGCCALLLAEKISFTQNFRARYEANYFDQLFAKRIRNAISTYENEPGYERVTKVVFYPDAEQSPAIGTCGDDDRALCDPGRRLGTIGYELGRTFSAGDDDPEVRDYFAAHNWSDFSDWTEDALAIKGDTIYVCVF